jgi:hypothetical protein
MRRMLLALTAIIAIGSAGSLVAGNAQAATFGSATGLRGAIEQLDPIDEVRHRCFRSGRGWVCPRHGVRRHHWRHRHHRGHRHRHWR